MSKSDSKFNPNQVRLGNLLHQADKTVLKYHNEALKPYGVSFHTAIILNFIVGNEASRSINQRAIENLTGFTNPAITKIVTSMTEMGLVERQPDPVDRRNHRLVSTEKGRELASVYRSVFEKSDTDIFSKLTEDERNTLIRILEDKIINPKL